MFKMKVISMAPMIMRYNDVGEFLEMEPLFWMKPEALAATPGLMAENITWATRVYHNFSLESVKVIKGKQTSGEILEIMIEDLRKNAEDVYLGITFDADGNEKMDAKHIKLLGSSVDSIITFDPKTFKEIIQVVKNDFKGKDIKNIRLMQDWVWDENTKQLSITYIGFKPIIDRVDANGNFLNSGPMFIRRMGWDSL